MFVSFESPMRLLGVRDSGQRSLNVYICQKLNQTHVYVYIYML